jgi:hypothetical protein
VVLPLKAHEGVLIDSYSMCQKEKDHLLDGLPHNLGQPGNLHGYIMGVMDVPLEQKESFLSQNHVKENYLT